MSHFADGRWNPFTGLIAAASGAPSLVGVTATVNGVPNVETQAATGVDQGTPALFTNVAGPTTLATVNVPRSGMYALVLYAKVVTAGSATQTFGVTAAYNDGAVVAAAPLLGQRGTLGASPSTFQTTLDAATQNATIQITGNIFCAAGSQIVLAMVGGGTLTTGAIVQVYWAVEAV